VLVALAAIVVEPAGAQEDATRFLQRGVELLEADQAAAAVIELERAVALRPEDPLARYHLGRALFTSGRAGDAVVHLEAALRTAVEPGPIQFLLGQVWLQLDRFEAAGSALAAASVSRPGYAPIGYYQAELCYRLGRMDRARQLLETLAEAAPGWQEPLVRSGSLALEVGDTAAAVRWFRSALDISADAPVLWMRLGTALVQDEQAYEALAAYRRAAELSPEGGTALVSVALQLINLDEHDEALAALDAVLIEDPDHGAIRHQRARLLSMEGEHETALREVDDAIADLRATPAGQAGAGVPVLAQATLLRADLLMKLGREAEAVEEVRALVADAPDYPEALFLLGNALVRRGDRSGTELLQRFKRLSDGREHRQLGDQFLGRNNDPERARAEYEAALQALPDDAGSLLGLGAVQRQTDQAEQAVATLRRARSAGADGVEWHREWVLALHSAGRPQEARQAWLEAVQNGLVLGSEVRAFMLESVPGC